MNFKVKGVISAIGEVNTTNTGVAVQQIHFMLPNGKFIYPSLLGTKVKLMSGILPGDVVEMEFYISGSKGVYNNVIIHSLTNLTQ